MRAPSLIFVAVALGCVCCADGISFKKLYGIPKLKKVSINARGRVDQSEALPRREKKGISQFDDEEDEGEPRLYDIDDTTNSSFQGYPHNIVKEATNSWGGKVFVSVLSGLASMLISSFFSLMLFSSVWWGFVKFCMFFFFTVAFTDTIVGDFSQSLGVFLLQLAKQPWLASFVGDLFSQTTASVGLGKRRPFPPGPNLWSYQKRTTKDPDFNIYRTLLTLLLLGSYLGRVVSCFLPLVPTWIDVLVAGGGLAYLGTRSSPQGDLARYLGFGLVASVGNMRAVASDVELFDRLEVISDRMISSASKLNEEHRLINKGKEMTSLLFRQASQARKRMMTEMSGQQVGEDEDEVPEEEEE